MPRKLLVTLILILFLFPFVSWYYLKRGLEWRKEAQAIMNGTTPVTVRDWYDKDHKLFSTADLENNVTLISRFTCDNTVAQQELLAELYDQFKETKKAHFILLDECATAPLQSDATKSNWHIVSCGDSLQQCDALIPAWPDGKSHALVDRHAVVRSFYSSTTVAEKRLLLEHMALLIPRERSDKVELKRGHNK